MTISDLVELFSLACVVAGVTLLAGIGWALVTLGLGLFLGLLLHEYAASIRRRP